MAHLKIGQDKAAATQGDLELLGIPLEGARTLDEKALRRAFREQSRTPHPDVRAHAEPGDDADGAVSIYELNAAYEAIRTLL